MRQKWLVYGGTSQSVDSCGLWIKPWKPSFKPTCGQFKEYQFSVASFSFSFDHTKISDLINFFFFYQNRIKVASIQIKWMEVWKKCCHNTGGSSAAFDCLCELYLEKKKKRKKTAHWHKNALLSSQSGFCSVSAEVITWNILLDCDL